ncbi:helix-turn-helix domain-containing protein [Chryseobacterium gallinarum]|uniref:Helix-turn-helix transcriptional regulator n=1 Tax=Chryseobacterium gallinarum TaxID=1324352 RepID=A0ABX6KT32_CHRGL|nr:helix-turn-helix domain-containing protein [Chryseobacterium gallinarum]QIY91383.1 helix-turn-helix transcriptional regulator [Chryseobacterium gallinarum]
MDRYVILMAFILFVYVIIFTFFIYDEIMSWYLLAGAILLAAPYLITRKRYSPDFIVTVFLVCVPIYSFYIILAFWENSVASFSILLPIPLGAYIFFPKRQVLMYTLYVIVTIITVSIVANNFNFDFPKHSQAEVKFNDILLFISNISVVFLLIHYKDKIKRLEASEQHITAGLPEKEKSNKAEIKLLTDSIDPASMEKLFERIESAMTEDMLFKDDKFNLSKLSATLDVNSSYISKSIRHKGYPNFKIFLNTYRINHIKKLFTETDFQKATLMYIYTEAGFSNQSTFNRVFKQIEGVTPSEYIQQNLKTDHDQNG